MSITTTVELVETLHSTRLLETAQLDKVKHAAEKIANPRVLTAQMLQRGWLTAYQANQILSGQGDSLVLGSYSLLQKLGGGGMGQVFKARHQKLGRVVALKVIRRERMQDANVLRRFHREIQAVAQLSHPNIVMAFDADEVDGTHFFTMEYVEGLDLSKRVIRLGVPPVALACEIIRQAALGLQHAHEKGLVHRDIKPSNIIVAGKDSEQAANGAPRVKLLDLGLARVAMPTADQEMSQITGYGLFIGTPDYVAPEQAANPHGADIRADLYSLGCTFYFLLAGVVPFPDSSPVNKLFKHQKEEPEALEKLRPDVPAPVADLVRKLMAKAPGARFQTPQELAVELDSMLGADGQLLATNSKSSWTVRLPNARQILGLGPRSSGSLGSGPSGPAVIPSSAAPAPGSKKPRVLRWSLAFSGGALLVAALVGVTTLLTGADQPPTAAAPPTRPASLLPTYVRRGSRSATILATLRASGQPTLEGTWHLIGPFDGKHDKGFDMVFPPEKEIALDASYPGKKNKPIRWQELNDFELGKTLDLRRLEDGDNAVAYLYHTFTVAEAVDLPLGLGSDDTMTVWLNGEKLFARNGFRGVIPEDDRVKLRCKAGRNELLLKICNGNGSWGVHVQPLLTESIERAFGEKLTRDFPPKAKEK